MLKMRVDVLNMHSHVLAYFVRPRRPKLTTLAAQHDRALGNGKLRMGHAATRTRSPEALRETEGAAEPVGRFFHVFVDEYGYHRCFRCRPVDYHTFPPASELIGCGDYIRGSNTKLYRCLKRIRWDVGLGSTGTLACARRNHHHN